LISTFFYDSTSRTHSYLFNIHSYDF
jgi:hypothetical protein